MSSPTPPTGQPSSDWGDLFARSFVIVVLALGCALCGWLSWVTGTDAKHRRIGLVKYGLRASGRITEIGDEGEVTIRFPVSRGSRSGTIEPPEGRYRIGQWLPILYDKRDPSIVRFAGRGARIDAAGFDEAAQDAAYAWLAVAILIVCYAAARPLAIAGVVLRGPRHTAHIEVEGRTAYVAVIGSATSLAWTIQRDLPRSGPAEGKFQATVYGDPAPRAVLAVKTEAGWIWPWSWARFEPRPGSVRVAQSVPDSLPTVHATLMRAFAGALAEAGEVPVRDPLIGPRRFLVVRMTRAHIHRRLEQLSNAYSLLAVSVGAVSDEAKMSKLILREAQEDCDALRLVSNPERSWTKRLRLASQIAAQFLLAVVGVATMAALIWAVVDQILHSRISLHIGFGLALGIELTLTFFAVFVAEAYARSFRRMRDYLAPGWRGSAARTRRGSETVSVRNCFSAEDALFAALAIDKRPQVQRDLIGHAAVGSLSTLVIGGTFAAEIATNSKGLPMWLFVGFFAAVSLWGCHRIRVWLRQSLKLRTWV